MLFPDISVIIPVYNRERSIRLCLDSLLNQEFSNFEIIVVDDGSSDATYDICKSYMDRDKRISVIKQDNGGPSIARNTGLSRAKGTYVTFLDSDDAYGCGHLLNIIQRERDIPDGYDLLSIGYTPAIVKNNSWQEKPTTYDYRVIQGRDLIIDYYFHKNDPYENNYYFIWNKVFKKSIIDKYEIRFPDGVNLGEDQIFLCKYLTFVDTLCLSSCVSYYCLSIEGMPPGLGGCLRTPEDYFKNQMANYSALKELAHNVQNNWVRLTATDYVVDRLITRICLRTLPNEKKKRKDFQVFISENIVPVIMQEKDNLASVKSRRIRFLAKLLLKEDYLLFFKACQFYNSLDSIFQIKNIVRYRIAKVVKKIIIK